MNDVLLWAGRLAGAIGLVVCVLALLIRINGSYSIAGFEVGTLFLGGTAAIVAGCFCLLLRMDDKR